jgi:hypothetical protein
MLRRAVAFEIACRRADRAARLALRDERSRADSSTPAGAPARRSPLPAENKTAHR